MVDFLLHHNFSSIYSSNFLGVDSFSFFKSDFLFEKWPYIPGDFKWPFYPLTLEVTNSPWKGHRPPSQKGHQQNCQVNLFLNFRNKFVHIFVTRQHKSTRLPPSDAASFFFANLKICIRYIGGRVAYVGKQKEILFIWAPVSNGGWDFTVSKTVVGTLFFWPWTICTCSEWWMYWSFFGGENST